MVKEKTAWRAFLVGCLLVVTPSLLRADSPRERDVSVTLATPPQEETPLRARLLAHCLTAGVEEQREWSVAVPWTGSLDLDPDLRWKLLLELPGYWAPEKILEPVTAEAIRFEAVPVGWLRGRLLTERETPPENVTLRLGSPPELRGRESPSNRPQSTFSCSVEENDFTCEVPSGEFDLRIEAEGWVPHYFWNVEVQPEKTTRLGSLRLERGASLVGWIETTQAADDLSGALVELVPPIVGWGGDPREHRRIQSRSRSTETNARGFFQFKAIASGGYVLTVRKEGFAPQQLDDLVISEARELPLDEPVLLHPSATLEVFLDPPTAGEEGRPWEVELSRKLPRSTVYTDVARGNASLEGTWRQTDLQDGTHRLIVESDGSTWLNRKIEITPDLAPLFIEIPIVDIEGRIRIGGEPLATTLAFGGADASPSILFHSDEEGRFSGVLPREGIWPVDMLVEGPTSGKQALESVEVRRKSGQRRARVDIALPDTSLSGLVVHNGEAVPAGLLFYRNNDEKDFTNVSTDGEGRFALRGLPPDDYDIQAYAKSLSSPWIRIHLEEKLDGPELRLELEEKIVISGQLFSVSGPVVGAQVFAVDLIGNDIDSTTSGADGAFVLEVSSRTVAADLLVAPVGFAVHMRRLWRREEGFSPLLIELALQGGTVFVPAETLVRIKNFPAATLHHGGASVGFQTLLDLWGPTGFISIDDGFRLNNMEAGEYALCRDLSREQGSCSGGILTLHGELRIHFSEEEAGDPAARPRIRSSR